MATRIVPMEEMLDRTARFKELRPSKMAFLDTKIPGHERDIYNVIGGGVTEDPSLTPAITEVQDFNVTYVGATPARARRSIRTPRSKRSSPCRAAGPCSGAMTARTR